MKHKISKFYILTLLLALFCIPAMGIKAEAAVTDELTEEEVEEVINTEKAALAAAQSSSTSADSVIKISSGKGTKAKPYVIKLANANLKKNFHKYVQGALFISRENKKKYYRIVIPAGTYHTSNKLKIFTNTTLVATGAKIYSDKGQNLIVAGSSKGPFVTGYGGHLNMTIIGGIWDGNYPKLKSQGKKTGHCIARFAHCTNLVIKNATFTHCNRNHAMEMAACKNVTIRGCKFLNTRVYQGINHAEALQIDICGKLFGYYNGNGKHYGCENVDVSHCTFSGVAEGVGSHACSKPHPYRNIKIHDNTFRNFTKRKRPGPDGFAAIHMFRWQNSRVYNNRINGAYIGVTIGKNNKGSKIYNNTMSKCRYAGVSGIWNTGSMYITNNTISSPGRYGVALEYARATRVQKNKVTRPRYYGIYLAGSASYADRITSNRVTSAGRGGIDVEQNASAGVISKNNISGSSKHGVRVKWFGKVYGLYSNNIFATRKSGVYVGGFSRISRIKYNNIIGSGYANKCHIRKNSVGVAINASRISMPKGSQMTLSYSAGGGGYSFKSSKKGVCSVGKNGKLKAKRRGKATITIRQNGCVSSVPVEVY